MFTTLVSAEQLGKVGTRNSKMPGPDFSLPPSKCQIGTKLAAIKGSTCAGCYAVKSERMYTSARKGWSENYDRAQRFIANGGGDRWATAIAFQVKWQCKKLGEPFMRWFGAGDLQSVAMLRAIVKVCELTPDIQHWLPTREATIVKQWRAQGGIEPANLVIRISATMVGDKPRNAPHTSTVHMPVKNPFTESPAVYGHACPANTAKHRALNNGKAYCGPCRACWDRDVANVSYPFH